MDIDVLKIVSLIGVICLFGGLLFVMIRMDEATQILQSVSKSFDEVDPILDRMAIWTETYQARHGVEATRKETEELMFYFGVYRFCVDSIMHSGGSFVPDTRAMREGLSALEGSIQMLRQTSTAVFKLE
jgi:HAMP domain-containing protein